MQHDQWRVRLAHILDAIDHIELAIAGLDERAFLGNTLMKDVVLWNFIVIGEAVIHIPEPLRELHPQIAWRLARNLRNFLAHEYQKIDFGIIWMTIRDDLPLLKSQILELQRLTLDPPPQWESDHETT